MTTDDLAGLTAMLAEHRSVLAVHCACLWRPSSFNLTIEQFRKDHERHVAAVIAAAGWVKGPDDLEPVRTYYRSLTPDGKLWCESRDPGEVRERSEGKGCTFERYDIYEVTEGWQPWAEEA